jgi:uncharacterized protein (DUF983 family)
MQDSSTPDGAARPFAPALGRALRGRCPACGQGRMFARFLKPGQCATCGQRWDLGQADDFPAYIVILLLGHILVPTMIEVNAALAIPLAAQAALWPGLAMMLAVTMIQPVKGGVIAFLWSRRMQGFA